jgi:hypothetical protein
VDVAILCFYVWHLLMATASNFSQLWENGSKLLVACYDAVPLGVRGLPSLPPAAGDAGQRLTTQAAHEQEEFGVIQRCHGGEEAACGIRAAVRQCDLLDGGRFIGRLLHGRLDFRAGLLVVARVHGNEYAPLVVGGRRPWTLEAGVRSGSVQIAAVAFWHWVLLRIASRANITATG